MGLNFGGSGGATESSVKSTADVSNKYGTGQTGVQNALGTNISQDLTASKTGTLAPGISAMKTAAAGAINKVSGGLLDRVNTMLASRGFGKSGTTGKAGLQSELGRQAQLAGNEANFANIQQSANSQNLLAALNYAFQSLGQSAMGGSQGNTSSWSVGGGVSV